MFHFHFHFHIKPSSTEFAISIRGTILTLTLFISCLFPGFSLAEYRAYQYALIPLALESNLDLLPNESGNQIKNSLKKNNITQESNRKNSESNMEGNKKVSIPAYPTKKMIQIITTLNPQAYEAYLGSRKTQLYLMRTWICPGVTARKKICPSPYSQFDELNSNNQVSLKKK